MAERTITTEQFPDVDIQAREVRKWREVYEALIEKLGQLGTETERDRLVETDSDTSPHRFIRDASHTFVFPPQEPLSEVTDNHWVNETPGSEICHEWTTRTVDSGKVIGHVLVSYDDAENMVSLSIEDFAGALAFDPAVPAAIAEALLTDLKPA